jgi:hypothetical protein
MNGDLGTNNMDTFDDLQAEDVFDDSLLEYEDYRLEDGCDDGPDA